MYKPSREVSDRTPKVGDIVHLKGESKNGENWRVGKITSLLQVSDGECMVTKVEVGAHEFIRSIGHLYPLEHEDNDVIDLCNSQLQVGKSNDLVHV